MDEVLGEARRLLAEKRWLRHETLLEHLVDQNPTVNQEDAFGFTLLHLACMADWPTLVSLLLRVPGIDVNAMTEGTPLIQAAVRGHADCVRLLLSDPRVCLTHRRAWITSGTPMTALEHALLTGYLLVVKLFLALQAPGACGRLQDSSRDRLILGDLVAAYDENPCAVRRRLRLELGILSPASHFALFVLVSDGYLSHQGDDETRDGPDSLDGSQDGSQDGSHDGSQDAGRRYLLMAAWLPMELQMLLAHRACDSAGDIVLRVALDPVLVMFLSSYDVCKMSE